MSNRYWINDSGNWNDSSHWSETSGGVSGATVPTSGDSVYFNNLSFTGTSTVTINSEANCNDFIWTGINQSVNLVNSSYNLNVYGSLFLSEKLSTSFASTGYLYLKASDMQWITSSGNTSYWNRIYMDNSGGTWVNQDNWTSNSTTLLPVNGTWNTNSKNITLGTISTLGITGTRTLSFGSSYILVGAIYGHGGWTIIPGTSTIETTGGSGGGSYLSSANYYNVIANNYSIWGNCTFNNVTINKTTTSSGGLSIGEYGFPNITIYDTLTIKGYNSTTNRLLIYSSSLGTQYKITTNNVDSANVDFRDIYLSGETIFDLSNIPGGAGDQYNNSGITFTSGQTQYFYTTGTTALWSDSYNWYLNTNGVIPGRVPLPQDDVIFDENSFITGCTLTINCGCLGRNLNMSGVTFPITATTVNNATCFGDYILGDNITPSGNYVYYFYNRSTANINTYNKTHYSIYLSYGGFVFLSDTTLLGGFGAGGNDSLYNIDFNNYNLSCLSFSVSYCQNGQIYARSGTIKVQRDFYCGAYMLFNEGNSTIKFEPTSTSSNYILSMGYASGYKLNNIWFSGNHTGYFDMEDGNIINEIKIDPGRKVRFTGGTTSSIKYLNAVGTASSGITIGSVTSGLTHTLSGVTNNWAVEYATISDSIVSPSQNAGLYSTDGGNNTGWTFGESNVRYWVGDSGNWNDAGHWSYTSGGVSGATIPTSGDSVYFDSNSFSTGSTITISTTANCYDMNWSGITQPVTLTNSAYNLNVYGNFILNDKLTASFSSTGYLYFMSSNFVDIITNGNSSYWNRFYFAGGGTYNLRDDWTSGIGNVGPGTFNTNNHNINWNRFWTQGDGITNLGTSTITTAGWSCTGTLNAGTSTLIITTNAGFIGGNKTYYDLIYYTGTGYPSGAMIGNNIFNNLTISGSPTIYNDIYISGNQIVNNKLILSGSNSTNYRSLLYSYTLGTQYKITTPSVEASNIDFRDIYLSGETIFDLSNIEGGSGDCYGNSGITFTSGQTQYYYHTGSSSTLWSDSSKWFLNSSGVTPGRVPLPQDNVIFDENSFTTGCTLSFNCERIGKSLDMSNVSQSITTAFSTITTESYGNFILGNNISYSGSYTICLFGRGDYALNTYNRPLCYLLVNCVNGVYTNQSDIQLSYVGADAAFQIVTGTFDFNDFNLINVGGLRVYGTVYLGNGTINLNGSGQPLSTYAGYDSKIYAEGSTVKFNCNSSSSPIICNNKSGLILNKMWFAGECTGYYSTINSLTVNELIINPGRKVKFTNGTTTTFDALISKGTSSSGITITSTVTGSTFTLSKTSSGYADVKYTDISYSVANNLFARASTDSGGNSGWTFNVPRYWVGDSGNITDASHWSATSGGLSGYSYGDEMIINGSFDSGITGWAGNYDVLDWDNINYRLHFSSTGGTKYLYSTTPMSFVSGKTYAIYHTNNSGYTIFTPSPGGDVIVHLNTNPYYYIPDNNYTYYFELYTLIAADDYLDDVSIKEVFSVPTSSNDIFFDENSFSTGSTVTINNNFDCGAIDFEGINQNVILSNSAYAFNVYGSMTLATGLTTSFTSTGYLYLKSNYHQFLRTSGVTTAFNRLYMDISGFTLVNTDDWYNNTSLLISNGSWYTNDKNIYFINYSDINAATGYGQLYLGDSNLYMNSLRIGANAFLDAGTSTITINKLSYSFVNYCIVLGKSFTFNNIIVNFITSYASVNDIDGIDMQGSTISNLIYNGYSSVGSSLIMVSDFYVDTLTLSGYNSSNYRLIVRSNTIGTEKTIYCNNLINASNVDFRDIKGSGTTLWDLSSISGGSGDCGGNSNIIFTSGQTQYFYATGSTASWSNVSNWFLNTSGVTTGRVPLPQDDAIFDENSFNQTTTLTLDCQRMGRSLNMNSLTNNTILKRSNFNEIYGDIIWSSLISWGLDTGYFTYLYSQSKESISYVNTYNINYPQQLIFKRGHYYLLSNVTCGQFNCDSSIGWIDLNDYDVTCNLFQMASSGMTLYMGNGTLEIKYNTSIPLYITSGVNLYPENSIIKFNPSSGSNAISIFIGGKTYHKLWLSGSHTGNFDIYGNNTFDEILIDPGRKVRFNSGSVQTSKYFNAIGYSGNTITIGSTTTGSTHSLIRTDNWFLDYCTIQDSIVSPNTNAGYNSIDGGNNTGWTFNASNLKYWVGDSGYWGDTSHWSYSIGGASGATLPLSSDKVFFNEYSFSSPSSIDINVDANCYDMLWTGVTQSVTISNTGHTLNIYKDIALYSGITWNFSETGYLYLKSVIDSYIITNGSILNVNRLYFDGDNNWVNLDDLNLGSSDIYHESGNWLTSGKTITTTGKYYTTGSTLKYLDLSTSTLNLGSYIDDYGVQLSAGTSQINISDFNSIFKGYDNTFYNVKFINGAYIYDNNIFNDLEISNDSNINYKLQLYDDQIINETLILSGTNSTNYRLLITSDEFDVQRSLFASDVLAYNVDFRDIVGDGSFDWDLSSIIGGSGDWGGNSGITFTTPQDQYLYSSGDTINWSDESVWFLGSGGSGGNGRMPLAQDNVIIDESFTSALEGYINFDIGDKIYCNDFDCYDINKFLFVSDNGDIPINIKGNLYLSPMFEFEQRTNIIKLVCRDSSTASLENSLLGIVSFLYGDYTIYGNTECESFQVYSDAKVTIYSQEIEITGEYSPALYIGGNNSYDTTSWCDGTTFKIDETGSSNIQIQPFSNDANCNIWLTGSITGDYEIKSDIPATTYYINYLLVDPGKSIKTSSGLTINFNNFSAVGTIESGITIGTIESGYTSTFNYTGPIVNKPVVYGQYLSIIDSVAQPSSVWYAGPTSTDLGNNSGWMFSLKGRLILYDSKLVLNKPISSHPLLYDDTAGYLFEYMPNYSTGDYDVVFNQQDTTYGISSGINNEYDNDHLFDVGKRDFNYEPTIFIKKEDGNIFEFQSENKNRYTVSFWVKLNRFSIEKPRTEVLSGLIRRKRTALLDLKYCYDNNGYQNFDCKHEGIISFGVMAPYYIYNNDPTYKFIYEPFSFTCTLTYNHHIYGSLDDNFRNRDTLSIYTDYSYNLNNWYFITMSINPASGVFNSDGGDYDLRMFVNNQQVNIAHHRSYVITNSPNAHGKKSRRSAGEIAAGPNFINKYGEEISNTNTLRFNFHKFFHLNNVNSISFAPIRVKKNLYASGPRYDFVFKNTGIDFGKLYVYDHLNVKNVYDESKDLYTSINTLLEFTPNDSGGTYSYDIEVDSGQTDTTYGIAKGMNYSTDWFNDLQTTLIKKEDGNLFDFVSIKNNGDYIISFWTKINRFPTKTNKSLPIRRKTTFLTSLRYAVDGTGYKNNSNNHDTMINFGAMAPYYIYNNYPTYKTLYEPFSFVTSISFNSTSDYGWLENGSDNSFSLYTDYSYELNKWYMVTLVINSEDHNFGNYGFYNFKMYIDENQVNISVSDNRLITNEPKKKFYYHGEVFSSITYSQTKRKSGLVAAGPNFINNSGETVSNYSEIERYINSTKFDFDNLNCVSYSPIKAKQYLIRGGKISGLVSRNSGIDFGKIYIYKNLYDINNIYNRDKNIYLL